MSKKNKKKFVYYPDWIEMFRERAKKLRSIAGITQSEMASKAGLSSPMSVSRFETGENDLVRLVMIKALLELADLNNIPRSWLLCIEDEKQGTPRVGGHTELLSTIREALGDVIAKAIEPILIDEGVVSPADMAGLEDGASSVADFAHQVAELVEPGFEIVDVEQLPKQWIGRYVPIIGRVAAGHGIDTTEAESHPAGIAWRYLAFDNAPEKSFALRVAGQSMTPDYNDGDIVIVDPTVQVVGGICAVITKIDGERIARIKKLLVKGKTAELHSTNKQYKIIRVHAGDVEAFGIWKHLPAVRRRTAG